ncbi:hypothetical protein ASE23_11940 [Rhizobium sp. Root73]|uniref:hypothetical protein n=1 Tax=unclassified Rhizobium TaxID=2613769 RepID=UPI000712F486|nr:MULTISPECIES: hypothetical protein [unclassified Rhizobium]KQV29027.1 hypothetical protein ASC96_13600 [Rhizobium sp. Root1204]KQY03521.1 hypothetical protein ASD36_14130 [Rhizobium sp. Root1334]KRC00169.1 hypothetical protein ASE23_11940 [Rhizobium sp. Root73]
MRAAQENLPHEYIGDQSLSMMRRVLVEECARREVGPDHSMGKDLAAVIMNAFQSGMTEEAELVVLVRNLCD